MKLLIFLIAALFSSNIYAFNINIDRDPFMNLVKLSQMKKTMSVSANESNKLNDIKGSLTLQASVVNLSDNRKSTALLLGPSGVPKIVQEGSVLRKDIVVSKILQDEIILSVRVKDKWEKLSIKIK